MASVVHQLNPVMVTLGWSVIPVAMATKEWSLANAVMTTKGLAVAHSVMATNVGRSALAAQM